jgi:uncharacterized protein with PIN domain
MSEVVLDASAVLALLRDEPGADIVAGHMPRSGPAANDPLQTFGGILVSGQAQRPCSFILRNQPT